MLRGVLEATWGTGRSARFPANQLPEKPERAKTITTHGSSAIRRISSRRLDRQRSPQFTRFWQRPGGASMGRIHEQGTANHPPAWFERPSGIVSVRIDTQTGLRVPDGCQISPDEIRTELFIRGTEPMSTSERCLNIIPEISPDPLDTPDALLPEQPLEPQNGTGGSRSLFERLFGRN